MIPAPAAGPKPAVLVTGATGLVGAEVMDQLRRSGVDVVGVSRRGSLRDSGVVAWDMSKQPPPDHLRRRHWDAIVNTAANTRWTMDPDEATAANVSSVTALGPLTSEDTHVIHVSTAYAVGLREDIESTDPQDYRNTYEWSKAHAERVARETFADLTVVRPPLIVGRRHDGRAARFSGMYALIRGLTVGTVPAVVAEPDAYFDAIPVDELAWLLADLAEERNTRAGSVLTVAAGPSAPTVEEAIAAVVGSLNQWRAQRGRPALDEPRLITPESWDRFLLPFVREHLTPRQLLILELLGNFEPYLALAKPLRPDLTVDDVPFCLATSTFYWAEKNHRVAALTPRPWSPPQGDGVGESASSRA